MITGVTELSVSVSVEDRDGGSRTVVRLAGEADVTTRALAEVLGAEAAKKPRLLLVDLSGLAFIDSPAVRDRPGDPRPRKRLRSRRATLGNAAPEHGERNGDP